MAKQKKPTAEDLKLEQLIEKYKERSQGVLTTEQKRYIKSLRRGEYQKEEIRNLEFALRLSPGEGRSPETEAKFMEEQRRAERKAVDLKYGNINYPKFFLRCIQIIAAVLIISHLTQRKTTITTSPEPAREWSYEKDANRLSINDLYGGNADAYCSGILPSKSTKKKRETVRIRPIAHGKYPGEYTIEYKTTSNHPKESPEDILDQIDEEDILDYMDGNID